MTKLIKVEGKEFQVLPDGTYRCECGAIRKTLDKLTSHLKTKSHYTALHIRNLNGNTVVFTSLLKPDLKVYR
jgi:hypothetical protein